MTQTINRIYASADQATAAVTELRTNGYQADEIHVVGPTDFDAGKNSSDDIVVAIAKGHVLRSDAVILAEGIQKGGTLVTVHAVFGAAARALDILDKHGPIASGLPSKRHPTVTWDEAAPVSSALMLPTRCDDPTVFATYSGMPTLMDGNASVSAAVGLPLLADQKSTLSEKFGLPLLSDNPAPLSSLFNIPLLIHR